MMGRLTALAMIFALTFALGTMTGVADVAASMAPDLCGAESATWLDNIRIGVHAVWDGGMCQTDPADLVVGIDDGQIVDVSWSRCPDLSIVSTDLTAIDNGAAGWTLEEASVDAFCEGEEIALFMWWDIDCEGNVTGYLHENHFTGPPVCTVPGFDVYVAGFIVSGSLSEESFPGPELAGPADGAITVATNPVLSVKPYAGFPAAAYVVKAEWIVADNPAFSNPVVHRETNASRLSTQYWFPFFVLDELTTYYWKVRLTDSVGNVSDWSETWSFTTREEFWDLNENGIRDELEVIDANLDLNGNGVPDIAEIAVIKVFNTINRGGQMGASVSSPRAAVVAVDSIDPADISETGRPFDMPLDLISARFTVPISGMTISVRVYFSEAAPASAAWLVYDPAEGWTAFAGATFAPDGTYVDLSLTDGGSGDADGVANGVIVDPGGFGLASWIQGKVTDAATGQPVPHATVSISDVSLNTAAGGEYVSIMLPGTYTAKVSADGYTEMTVPGIVVPEGGVLEKDFTLSSVPAPNLRVNGKQGTVSVGQGTALVELSLTTGKDAGTAADWWLVAETPSGWYYLQVDSTIRWAPWLPTMNVTLQTGLVDLPWIDVGQFPGLPTASGTYTFYFGVDLARNGVLDLPLYYTFTSMIR